MTKKNCWHWTQHLDKTKDNGLIDIAFSSYYKFSKFVQYSSYLITAASICGTYAITCYSQFFRTYPPALITLMNLVKYLLNLQNPENLINEISQVSDKFHDEVVALGNLLDQPDEAFQQ